MARFVGTAERLISLSLSFLTKNNNSSSKADIALCKSNMVVAY